MGRILALAAGLAAAVTGCSPFSAGGDPFAAGRDARVFNAATGRYEWPEPPRPRPVSDAVASEPVATEPADARVFNPATGRHEWLGSSVR